MNRATRRVASPHVVSIEDFRPLAQRKLPRVVFDYLDGGAEGEVTLRENCRAFQEVTFRPRHAVAVPHCDLSTRVLGFDFALPAQLAPVGYSRLMDPGGEVAAARAAGIAGTAYILSTISGHRLEDVKAASSGHVFYQLYLLGGRGAAEAAIERARLAGFSALFVTIDTAVAGMRERDFRNGMKELISGGLLQKLPFLPQVLSRPGWLLRFLLDGGMPPLPNVVIPGRRTDAAGRCQRCVGKLNSDVARSAVDPRPLAGTHGYQGSPYWRRCSKSYRRRSRCLGRVESWSAPVGLRSCIAARLAGSGGGRERSD